MCNVATYYIISWYINYYAAVLFFLYDTTQDFQCFQRFQFKTAAIPTVKSTLWWRITNHLISRTVCGTFQRQINKRRLLY